MGDISKLFNPKTIALIGASEEEGSVGQTLMKNLLSGKGRSIFPVNPNRASVMGVKCYPTIKDVPEPVDLAVIAVPAKIVPDIVEQCGEAKVNGLIIISAGFKEIGEEGRKLEEKIRSIRSKYGMRIIGPNCLGVIRPAIGLNATFLRRAPEPGHIAFISQSGALGSAILDWAIDAHIGFSMFVSLGSMLDVDFGDLIDYLGNDPNTRSIIIYMESIGNARRFMSASRGFARTKPIIVVKSGRFSESAKAATSHTGALAGDNAIYDAAFKRAGVVRVKEVEDMFNCASVLDTNLLPKGPRIAVVTNAGGPGVMAVDSIIENKLTLANLSDETIKLLDSFLPSYWSKSNPVDILGDADIERYEKAIEVCTSDPNVDGLIIIYTPQGAAPSTDLAGSIIKKVKHRKKPVLTVWIGGSDLDEAREMFYQNDIPTYNTPEQAVRTYSYMYAYQRNLELLYETPEALSIDWEPPRYNLKAMIRRIINEGRTFLTEDDAERFLENYGIQVPPHAFAKDAEEAIYFAHQIRYPIVLKVLSHDIVHKSDVGGVTSGIHSDEELRKEIESMTKRINEKLPYAKIKGFYIQKMVERIDYELIMGCKKDPYFGSVILFGMGGIGVEVFNDFSIGLPPLNQVLAKRVMEDTKVYGILKGYRNKPPADMRQLEETLVRFSDIVVDFPEILEMDVNPLVVSEGKVIALDARIVLDKNAIGQTDPFRHMIIMPYPEKYIIPWTLRDGTDVLIRPIRPEDDPMWLEFVKGLSEESLRNRFFYVLKEITREMIIRYCNIDYDREIAFVAELKVGGQKKFIGISRLIMDPDKRNGEFAVVVADEYQGKGLGYKLVDMLIGVAQEHDLETIYGLVLSSNKRMLSLCMDLGFKVEYLSEEESRVYMHLK
ncbi:MAG: bifunctional acetate--CoA ligase family protein/GNAT family N-acetyltransferase [Thermoproteota archaeon]